MATGTVRIAASSFEGLFVRALKVEGPLVGKLRAVGFDPTRLEPSYPVEVWREALRLAGLEYFPTRAPNEAEFELGRRMVDGYFDTLVGKVIQAAMPFLKADTLCVRLPRFFSSGVVGDLKMPETKKLGDRHYETTLYGDQGVPWFTAGAVDAALRYTRVTPHVQVSSVKPDHFTIDITWT
ncbi:MAG: DUF2378 family protein [Myxococcota bacterium]